MRKLKESEVEFSISIQDEDISPDGQFDDPETLAYVKEQMELNPWGWCIVKVTASWEGFKGSDYLGGCSYKDEEDFKKGGYLEQMKAEALKDLNQTLSDTYTKLAKII